MRLVRACMVALLAAAVAVGCDEDEGPADITMAALEDSWQASSFTYTNTDDPNQQFDIVGAGGSLSVAITSTGTNTATFSADLVVPSAQGPIDCPGIPGTLTLSDVSVSSGTITVDFNEAHGCVGPIVEDFVATFTLSGTGNTLTWNLAETSFDFPPQDGTEEPASLQVVLARQ